MATQAEELAAAQAELAKVKRSLKKAQDALNVSEATLDATYDRVKAAKELYDHNGFSALHQAEFFAHVEKLLTT